MTSNDGHDKGVSFVKIVVFHYREVLHFSLGDVTRKVHLRRSLLHMNKNLHPALEDRIMDTTTVAQVGLSKQFF